MFKKSFHHSLIAVFALNVCLAIGAVSASQATESRTGEFVEMLQLDSPIESSKLVGATVFAAGDYWSIPQSDGSVVLQIRDARSGKFHLVVIPESLSRPIAKEGIPSGVLLQPLMVVTDASGTVVSGSWAMWTGAIGGPNGTHIGTLTLNRNGDWGVFYLPR